MLASHMAKHPPHMLEAQCHTQCRTAKQPGLTTKMPGHDHKREGLMALKAEPPPAPDRCVLQARAINGKCSHQHH